MIEQERILSSFWRSGVTRIHRSALSRVAEEGAKKALKKRKARIRKGLKARIKEHTTDAQKGVDGTPNYVSLNSKRCSTEKIET